MHRTPLVNRTPPALRRALSAACFAVWLVAPACTAPAPGGRDPLAGLQRVLALDFGSHHDQRRGDGLFRTGPLVLAAVTRVPDPARLPSAAGHELQRPHALVASAGRVATTALAKPTTRLDQLPTFRRCAQRLAAGADALLTLFGTANDPLGEIDDRRHRTRYDDDRPEATLWQRLRRRLQL